MVLMGKLAVSERANRSFVPDRQPGLSMRTVLTACNVALDGLAEGTASVIAASRCLMSVLLMSLRGVPRGLPAERQIALLGP